jgi:hypothetical protein
MCCFSHVLVTSSAGRERSANTTAHAHGEHGVPSARALARCQQRTARVARSHGARHVHLLGKAPLLQREVARHLPRRPQPSALARPALALAALALAQMEAALTMGYFASALGSTTTAAPGKSWPRRRW